MDLHDTMLDLWETRARFEDIAQSLDRAGESEGGEQLSLVANRYGNALLELESVIQQYEDALLALPEGQA